MMVAGSPSGIVALGYRRSLIELRNNLGSLPGHLMFPVIAVVTISIVRHSDALAGRGASFGNYALIGILLINTLLSGVMGAASTVMQERMDGTLLRSSCLPHGKVLSHFQLALTAFAVALPLLWLVTGRTALSPVSTAVLLVVAPAGLLSLLPLAVVVGAMLRSPRQLSLASISVMLIGAASGAFHPIAGSGGLTQAGAMTLPTFWVSASLRNALLPESSHSGDPSDLTVLAFELSGSRLDQSPSLLRIEDIRELSSIGFIIDSSDECIAPSDVVKIKQVYELDFDLISMPVIDTAQHKLGKVNDSVIDSNMFVITQLSVRRPLFQRLTQDELLISRHQIVSINDDNIVVKAPTVPTQRTALVPASQTDFVNPFRTQPDSSDSQ